MLKSLNQSTISKSLLRQPGSFGMLMIAVTLYFIHHRFAEGLKKMDTKLTGHLHVRTKIWIENDHQELLFGKGKTEILELIAVEGSIAGAAEKMGMSYKKAWSHIKILRQNIADELVVPQKGGQGTGGTMLTLKATELISKYRQLQKEIEDFADERFKELFCSDETALSSS
jgi:molybdate transport system regulatory protein